ncbi:hypothetical protein, partial [Yoonia sp.]|uniref:hypothetical protein n=1 Tax=Yoonia sp. TaxID=2212373 RepID=UPI00397553AC
HILFRETQNDPVATLLYHKAELFAVDSLSYETFNDLQYARAYPYADHILQLIDRTPATLLIKPPCFLRLP